MKQSTIAFVVAESCIICLIGVNIFFNYQFETMDLHKESVGKYYDELVKTRNNIVANSNLMNTILSVLGIFLLSMFIIANVVPLGKFKENHEQKE